ncbi:tetratricopeptide repeat protein [Laspinema olomoucense]|uniref:Tetratricopeptide repeat protein n=1 Tax=Laspinema olomoucense D3b TaxID=2953688 RepID=A0ABT2NJC1_9CYAN|nr:MULTISPECIES: tetratricopeptide repeat protein [unclassified Laspinema]MCT7973898.1 tetratricopeptide repeat protein [Laspinema sp. D3d]MCT7981396.1 tetratricopeptide repeat protein [Laspinema sp. D3b]MCT7989707.1 tetratricopeptide repeat protein [Laspinema sp. D3a]
MEPIRDLHPLRDAELEHYFLQLLDGIHQGWQQVKVRRFFEAFSDRVSDERWSDWLRQFGSKLLASPVPNQELAVRLQRLGELGYGSVSTAARQIATQLLARETPSDIHRETPTPNEEPAQNSALAGTPTASRELNLGEIAHPVESSAKAIPELAPESGPLETAPTVVVSLDELGTVQEQEMPGEIQPLDEPLNVEGWFTRGVECLEAGDDRAALNAFNRVIELEPTHAGAWMNRGNALFNLEQAEDALSAYDRAIELRPDDGFSWGARGDALYDLERIDEALISWNKSLELKPDNPEIWYNKGLALGINLGQWDEALTSLEQAIALNSNDVQFWFYRGIALSSLNQLEEALTSWDKVLEIKPDFRDAWINKGVVLQKLGRYSEAIEANNQAIGLLSH